VASFASLTGQEIPKGQAPDSENHIEALLGTKKMGRDYLVAQSNGGAPFGLRHGTWKLVGATGALFDLTQDLSESKNVAATHPERIAAMKAKLAEITRP